VRTDNRARVPELRELVEIADACGMSHSALERKAGVGRGVIDQWRRGQYGANMLSVTCVAEALGYRLKWEKIDD
jgi:DNA transposition AAA+ family ATPase